MDARLGQWTAFATSLCGAAYLAVLVAGFLSLAQPTDPIADPWFSLLEVLILAQAPALVLLFSAIHTRRDNLAPALSLAGLAFIACTAMLTCAVHFSILTLSRSEAMAATGLTSALFAFEWPSLAYAVDILAWDFFYPLAALCAGLSIGADGPGRWPRRLLIVSAVLAFAGLAGAFMGNMSVRNIGIIGYAVILPVAAACLIPLFNSERA